MWTICIKLLAPPCTRFKRPAASNSVKSLRTVISETFNRSIISVTLIAPF